VNTNLLETPVLCSPIQHGLHIMTM